MLREAPYSFDVIDAHAPDTGRASRSTLRVKWSREFNYFGKKGWHGYALAKIEKDADVFKAFRSAHGEVARAEARKNGRRRGKKKKFRIKIEFMARKGLKKHQRNEEKTTLEHEMKGSPSLHHILRKHGIHPGRVTQLLSVHINGVKRNGLMVSWNRSHGKIHCSISAQSQGFVPEAVSVFIEQMSPSHMRLTNAVAKAAYTTVPAPR